MFQGENILVPEKTSEPRMFSMQEKHDFNKVLGVQGETTSENLRFFHHHCKKPTKSSGVSINFAKSAQTPGPKHPG